MSESGTADTHLGLHPFQPRESGVYAACTDKEATHTSALDTHADTARNACDQDDDA